MSEKIKPYSYDQTMANVPLRAVFYRTDKAIYKYIYSEGDRTEELYELVSDPAESSNLMGIADTALIARMREIMAEQKTR